MSVRTRHDEANSGFSQFCEGSPEKTAWYKMIFCQCEKSAQFGTFPELPKRDFEKLVS
jgi:hypothetical protein